MNSKRKILVYGNPLVKEDSLPLRILPKLRKRFPKIQFTEADPTELLQADHDELWILDVAKGISDAVIINDLSLLEQPSSETVSVHDYDLGLDLALLAKLGKLEKVRIIAIPMGMEAKKALESVTQILKAI